jgi:hypothetical protein
VPYSPDLDRLLTEGARYRDERDEYVIERHKAGEVRLPTGQVVGCDPLTDAHAASSFTVTAPAGTYPLYVWVAVLYRDGVEQQRRVAALQLVVSDRPPVRYQMAMTAGQDLHALGENSYFGFPVGAGTATLADLTAVRALATWDFERLDATYIPARIPLAPVPGGIYTAVTDEATGANVTAVASGWGDGLYPRSSATHPPARSPRSLPTSWSSRMMRKPSRACRTSSGADPSRVKTLRPPSWPPSTCIPAWRCASCGTARTHPSSVARSRSTSV